MHSQAKKISAGRPKSDEKRRKILTSAATLFLSQGFERTSMDAVAKHSGVSKQTVYSHFTNKDVLFNAVIEKKCRMHKIDDSNICSLSQPLATLLENIGLCVVRLLVDPEVISMYATVIAESKSNPHVAELFYEIGPKYSVMLVSSLLQEHPESKLDEHQSLELSMDFFNMLKGEYHARAIFNMDFEMTEQNQQILAKRTAEKLMLLIQAAK
ncbi:TetR/AcrR family transcriptional regulator [Glaciecola sp. 1036]|uniref:TetR/AcrR family transcriptional regulator n=1 Tax=Alteromonadaceae TaxID=72275 RepID=UPI003D08881A